MQDTSLRECLREQRRLQRDSDLQTRAGRNPFARPPKPLQAPSTAPARGARPRGAGRPARRAASRSSTRSGDSGDGEPGEPPPLAVTIAAGDGSSGDTAVARTFERILAAQHPGSTWSATP